MKFLIPWSRGRRSTYCIAHFMFFMTLQFHLGDFVFTLLPNVWHLIREWCIDFFHKLLLIFCNRRLFSIFPIMLFLPQINYHLKFSINPQSPINLRPYPKFKSIQASIQTQAQPQTRRLKRKIQIDYLKKP